MKITINKRSVSRRNVLKSAVGFVAVGLGAALATLGFTGSIAAATKSDRGKWECQNDECEPFVYDPAVGIPDLDIPPGIPFEDLPDDFLCPICGDVKGQFLPLEDTF